MEIEDDFEKSLMESVRHEMVKTEDTKPSFVATKTATLYLDYDEWGLGFVVQTTTSEDTAERLGNFYGDIEIQWCQERNEYRLPNDDACFSADGEGFCYLVSFVAKKTTISRASALFLVSEMLKQYDIPFPSIKGSPLEWLIFQEQGWEDIAVGRLISSQLISRTESKQKSDSRST